MSQSEIAIANLKGSKNAQVVLTLSVAEVFPDPEQPRKFFDQDKIVGLAQSITSTGQDTPIIVMDDGEKYIIISGERRWRACHLIESKTIKAIVIDEPETVSDLRVKQIVENIQREDFKPIDLANAYAALLGDKKGKYKNAAMLAADLGINETTLYRTLKVLEVSDDIKELVNTGVSSVDAALDLHAIAKVDAPLAKGLAAEAKETGLLERKKTRNIKEKLQIKPAASKPISENSAVKKLLNSASDFVTGNDYKSAIDTLKLAIQTCEDLMKKTGKK